jgi:protein SCO1/2
VRRVAGALLAAVLVLLAACTSSKGPVVNAYAPSDPSGYRGAVLPQPYEMPSQTLTDTSGQAYNLKTSPSKPVTLVFFGYTHCPDVCLSVLSDVALALNRMADSEQDAVQMIFITTDPARDTPRAMRRYLDRIDPSFLGLTGSLTTIKGVAERLGVAIEGTQKLASGGYDVAHSAQVIGFDKHRAGILVWTPGTPIGDLRHDIQLLVSRQQ